MPDKHYAEAIARVRLMAGGDWLKGDPVWDLSPNDREDISAVLARLDALEKPARGPDYKHLQTLCDDIAAHLEAAQLREQDGRGTTVEMQQAERSVIDLFRGIVRAGAEITAKRMAKATNGKDT